MLASSLLKHWLHNYCLITIKIKVLSEEKQVTTFGLSDDIFLFIYWKKHAPMNHSVQIKNVDLICGQAQRIR